MISKEQLAEFLKEANQNTYANKTAVRAASTRPGSKDYHFEEGNLVYHDTYFGSKDFLGEEVVYLEEKPIWGANYFGFLVKPEVSTEEVYTFLRKALMRSHEHLVPVRGPAEFSEGSRQYRVHLEGDLAQFSGTEEIVFEEKLVYRGFIHGGFVA